MNRAAVFAAFLAALLSVPGWAQKSSPADLLFESARQKETLEGDLKGAIREYEEIVNRHSGDRGGRRQGADRHGRMPSETGRRRGTCDL